MTMRAMRLRQTRAPERGAAAVEFALVAMFGFFLLLIGIMELGRVFFTWNTAGEITRRGARMAAVCDMDDPAIKARMHAMLPAVPVGSIRIDYLPGGCTRATCETVKVAIQPGVTIGTSIPFVPFAVDLPPFETTLPRESMDSAGGANPVCN